jgi:hypothetical protein
LPWNGTLRRCALALVLLSVAWRTTRFLLQFPIWGDEAFLTLNFLDRGYLDLTQPLRYIQVAPLLFLWGELTVYRLLGGAELALRLLPFAAGLGTLVLFWRLARQTLSPLARLFAVGIFAVSYYPMRHSCEVKPYSLDLLVALALTLLALRWLRRPDRLRPLFFLTLLVPLALAASYPAVFVAGAVSVVLLPTAWRQPGWKPRTLFLAYNVLMVAGFMGSYLLAGVGQFQSAGGTENSFWVDWFMPQRPLPLAGWLVKAHTGNMLAYPVGGPNGASAATFLLCAAGVWQLARDGRRRRLVLLGLPFLLTLVAAALERYPYGGSARVAQHLAPAICLLAGAGLAALITRLAPTALRQRRAALGACAVLAIGGVAGIGIDLCRPYKTPGDAEVRRIVNDVARQVRPADQVVVWKEKEDSMGPSFEWYLRQHPDRIAWEVEPDWERLARGGDLWVLAFGGDPDLAAGLADRLRDLPRALRPVHHEKHVLQLGRIERTIERCLIVRWSE